MGICCYLTILSFFLICSKNGSLIQVCKAPKEVIQAVFYLQPNIDLSIKLHSSFKKPSLPCKFFPEIKRNIAIRE